DRSAKALLRRRRVGELEEAAQVRIRRAKGLGVRPAPGTFPQVGFQKCTSVALDFLIHWCGKQVRSAPSVHHSPPDISLRNLSEFWKRLTDKIAARRSPVAIIGSATQRRPTSPGGERAGDLHLRRFAVIDGGSKRVGPLTACG